MADSSGGLRPFSEVNLEACYWAGFLAADGHLAYGRKGRSSRIVCALAMKDLGHLRCLGEYLQDHKEPYWEENNGFGAYRINMYGNEDTLLNLVTKFGVHPQKSDVLYPPILPSKEHELAYLVGYIDGDGSVIWRPDGSVKAVQVFGNPIVIRWAKNLINERWPPLVPKRIKPTLTKLKNGFLFRVEGKRAFEIVDYVRTIDIPLIPRKWGNM